MHEHVVPASRPGDKVRFRTGANAGERGIVRTCSGSVLEVEIGTGETVQVSPDQITNYSLAARRAWATMPKRAGRPTLHPSLKKRKVSMRLDQEVWARLGEAVERGFVASREDAANQWLREKLDELFQSSVQNGQMDSGAHLNSIQEN